MSEASSELLHVPSPPSDHKDTADLLGRSIVSIAVCALLSWQLVETLASARTQNEAAPGSRFGSCYCLRGSTPLQWFLLLLMTLSVIEGVLGVVADLLLVGPNGVLPPSAMVEEVNISIVLGKVGDAIVSLMIIGLGVNGHMQGLKRARLAIAFGCASLVWRRLPAPLVLVVGVSCLQRKPKPPADEDDESASSCGCFSLQCALRPLLALALLETLYAGMIVDDKFQERMKLAQQQTKALIDASKPEGANEMLMLLDRIQPAQLLELASIQLGEMVQFGVVVALGLSGHAHGLRYVRLPIVTALVPGLPSTFAVVFYFLLETRQSHAGGCLLPLHRSGSEDHPHLREQ